MAAADYQDRPYDPNDPSTWEDPSGNPIPTPNTPADPAGAGLNHAVSTAADYPDPGTPDPAPPPDPTTPDPAAPPADGTGRTKRGPTWPENTTPGEWDQHSQQWNPPAPTAPPPAAPSAPAWSPSPITIDPATAAYNARLRQMMLDQLGQLGGPVGEDDAQVAPALAAYRAQSQRDQQTDRESLAERFYAMGEGGTGLQGGGFNNAIQQGMEAGSANRANFSGNLIWNASQQKRQQLQAMMGTAVGAGQSDVAQQIQEQMGNIDANLRSQGLTQQNSQFNDQLAAQYAQLTAELNRQAMMAAIQGRG